MACKCTECKCGKFTEDVFSENTIISHFDHSTHNPLFKWHADDEDHWLKSLNENDWSFQFDNESPVTLEPGKIIQIPAGTTYRLIQGNSPISISIKS